MVLASGLTSTREPASFAKRLIEAALDGRVAFILTETLLGETRDVLLLPEFPGHMSEEAAETLIEALRAAAARIVDDTEAAFPRRCSDEDDDYLVDAAMTNFAMLVSRDKRAQFERVPGLDYGPPGTALRRAGLLTD
jgi:predicted nucleic acid-binding protein